MTSDHHDHVVQRLPPLGDQKQNIFISMSEWFLWYRSYFHMIAWWNKHPIDQKCCLLDKKRNQKQNLVMKNNVMQCFLFLCSFPQVWLIPNGRYCLWLGDERIVFAQNGLYLILLTWFTAKTRKATKKKKHMQKRQKIELSNATWPCCNLFAMML